MISFSPLREAKNRYTIPKRYKFFLQFPIILSPIKELFRNIFKAKQKNTPNLSQLAFSPIRESPIRESKV